MDIQENAKYFKYLYRLQESGRTNMWGAAEYLQTEMGLGKKKAKEILLYWMQNYETIAQELGIEI